MSDAFKSRAAFGDARRRLARGRCSAGHPGNASQAQCLERALHDERMRLGRELHDGPLQSLAGAALQLEALRTQIGSDAPGIRQRLREIQQTLLEEERDLRRWIQTMKEASPTEAYVDAGARIARLCQRVQRQWGLPIRFAAPDKAINVPAGLAHQLYRLVQESLSNVVKHARATIAQVEPSLLRETVRIIVKDNGRGFPFHDRLDLTALNVQHVGPLSIKERIASVDGELFVTSSACGACLEMIVPLRASAPSSGSLESRARWRRAL